MKSKLIFLAYVLLCIEVACRAVLFFPSFCRRLADGSDAGNRLWWTSCHLHRREGDFLSYAIDDYDPVLGWRLKPGLKDFPFHKTSRVSSNSKGIRGRKEYNYEKPSGVKKRILILGDSFTFGEKLGDDETYPYYLQQALGSRYEVINMGVHGYGHDQMLIQLNKEGVLYKPDIVVLGYFPGDMMRNISSFFYFSKPQYILENGRLKLTHVPVPSPRRVLCRQIFHPYFFDFISIGKFLWEKKRGTIYDRKNKITTALLDEMRGNCRKIGAEFVVFYLTPQSDILSPKKVTDNEDFIEKFTSARGIPFINPRDYFRKHFGAFYEMHRHYNAALCRDAAAVLADRLKNFL